MRAGDLLSPVGCDVGPPWIKFLWELGGQVNLKLVDVLLHSMADPFLHLCRVYYPTGRGLETIFSERVKNTTKGSASLGRCAANIHKEVQF